MRASCDRFSTLAFFDLEDVDFGEGKRTAYPLGDTLDLDLLTFLC